MDSKPSERLLQVALGILLIVASGLYLWRDTLLPILRTKPSLEGISDAVRLGVRYWSWKDRAEEARLKAERDDREREIRQGPVPERPVVPTLPAQTPEGTVAPASSH